MRRERRMNIYIKDMVDGEVKKKAEIRLRVVLFRFSVDGS
jgi:hypothetical protein